MVARSTCPCTQVKHLADLQRNKGNSQQYPSVYEDRRPKNVEDTEKPDGNGDCFRTISSLGPAWRTGWLHTPAQVCCRTLGREPGQWLPPLPNKV